MMEIIKNIKENIGLIIHLFIGLIICVIAIYSEIDPPKSEDKA
jgi:hypothetical protein